MTVSPFVSWPPGENLVLASRSPRRAELLAVAGIPFEVAPPHERVEREHGAGLAEAARDPGAYAESLALAKARAVAADAPGRVVLGADTIVLIDDQILEKPTDEADAFALLSRLSGRSHVVITALALLDGRGTRSGSGAREHVGHESTLVRFLPLEPRQIRAYIATGEPMDKAGAYGIQGYGALMVAGVEGCYFNVMGLPLARLGRMLSGLPAAADDPEGPS